MEADAVAMTPSQLKAFLADKNPSQRKAFRRLAEFLEKRNELSDYLEAASAMVELRPANSYRKKWMEELCLALEAKGIPISTSLGYRLLRFVKMFPGPQGLSRVKKLEGKVPWDGMMRILHIGDKKLQESILAKAAAEELSSRELRRLISKETAYRRPRGGNPPAESESHPNRALRNLVTLLSKWPMVCEVWLDKNNKILKTAMQFEAGRSTDDFLMDLKAAVGDVEAMAESAKSLSARLAIIQQKLQQKHGTAKASPTRPV